MENKIKSLLLAVQKNDFARTKELVKECEEQFDNHTLCHTEIVNCLSRQNSGDTCLHVAARYGHLSILRYLVEEKSFSIELRNHDRKTPLHDCAQFSHLNCVQYLLDKGADVNAVKKADWTPLMLASTKSNVDIIQVLLEHGADPFYKNKDGWNSFHISCREGHLDIIKLLVNSVDNKKDLCNAKTKNGRKPIHTAALHGHCQVVDFILCNGYNDVDDIDNCGSTPLMDACRSNSTELVDLLLDVHGADINILNKEGFNCLYLASEAGANAVVQQLCRRFKKMGIDISLAGIEPDSVHLLSNLWMYTDN